MSDPSPLRCLFIKPKLIGDTLLLTPTLQAVRKKYPNAAIDVLIRSGCESILEGCTAHNRIFTTAPPDTDRNRAQWPGQWETLRQLRQTYYDWIFECSDTARGRYAALSARGRRRVFNRQELDTYGSVFERTFWPAMFSDGVRFEWRNHHAVEGSYRLARDFLQLPADPPPLGYSRMEFDPATARLTVSPGFKLSRSRLVIHCGTRLASKTWPEERWVELVAQIAARFDQVFLSTGPSEPEVDLARKLAAIAPAKIFRAEGPLAWSQLAALLQGARLFVGVDTAAMHLAAACQCPSVVIWGPTSAVIFGPLSPNTAIVVDNRIVRPPYGGNEAHEEARLASRNTCASVLQAVDVVLEGRAPPSSK